MKPFKCCPVCRSFLRQISIGNLLEEVCSNDDCECKYRQSFESSFEDDHITFMKVYTKNFFLYSYHDVHPSFPGETHVYYIVFPRGKYYQQPAISFKNLNIDFDKLDELDRKFKTLTLFA